MELSLNFPAHGTSVSDSSRKCTLHLYHSDFAIQVVLKAVFLVQFCHFSARRISVSYELVKRQTCHKIYEEGKAPRT